MRGGILAEEMGLGKTVEMLALIMLHERPEGFSDVDAESSELLVVKTTIVVTPSVILQQWIAETANHAPHLATHNYTGANSPSDPVLTAEELAQFDLVFVSYEVLRSECAIAMGDSRRSRRFERKYERPTTPLTSILWWRVVLDEAQMVETVGSQAAKMVRLLPRVNAWAVTGTPAPRSQWKDFYGLFLFLDAHPFATTKALSLLGQPRYSGIASLVFRTLMHRNTKKSVGSELVIPAQEQWLAHLPFNAVEKHYYDQLYEKCAELRSRPAMVAPHFLDETNSKAIRWRDKMEIERRAQLRTWLLRLRQVCCHPQVGEQNKRFFGEKIGSMNDVLRRLFNQCLTSVMTSERSLWTLRVQLAQMLEYGALLFTPNIFFSILKEIRARIEFCQAEYAATKKIVKADSANDDGDSDQDDDDGSPEVDVADTATPGVNPIKEHLMHLARTITSLRAFEHSIVFFIACSYHSSNVEARETEFYEAAEAIRNDILRNARRSVDAAKLKTWKTVGLLPSPTGEPNPTTTHAARALWDAAEAQRAALERWRSRILSLSNPPGMDDEKPSGEEYLQGLDVQAELNVLLDEYGKMLNDRRELLNGIVFAQPDTQPVDGQDDEARLLRGALSAKRRTFSLQRGASHLLAVVRALRQQADTVVALPAPEKKLAELAAQAYASGMEIQLEGLAALQKEMDRFRHLGNVRIMYYRQLQRLSDDVEAPDRPEDPRARIAQLQEPLRAAEMKLARETGRFRYLSHLMTREAQAGGGGGCVICKSDLVAVAQLTACGHFYCSDCVRVWIGRFGKCALCQHKISVNEVTPIAMSRPNDRDHNNSSASTVAPAPGLRRWGRGDDGDDDGTLDFGAPRLAPDVIEAIQSIKIDGSYGTKLDFILRHLVYLKQQSALASLVFSQWEQVLDILADGCRRNGIAVVRIDSGRTGPRRAREEATRRFITDPAVDVMMLNSASQSSGLSLVQATHVFLVEPVARVGLEMQAISRVHRIGQTQKTHVHRHLIAGTVEERVALLSRRSAAGHAG
ncbi:SNF2 family N-terminal domain-containing protein, partial [Zopfochytrium polystomum]